MKLIATLSILAASLAGLVSAEIKVRSTSPTSPSPNPRIQPNIPQCGTCAFDNTYCDAGGSYRKSTFCYLPEAYTDAL